MTSLSQPIGSPKQQIVWSKSIVRLVKKKIENLLGGAVKAEDSHRDHPPHLKITFRRTEITRTREVIEFFRF